MQNIVTVNGKKFIRPARLPKGAYPQKKLKEILAPYMSKSKKQNKTTDIRM